MKNEIKLGYIAMYKYTPNSRLFPDWQYEDKRDLKYQEEIEKTPANEKILSGNKTYTLTIDYPLSTPFKFTFDTLGEGMTRRQIVNLIVKSYNDIYQEENKSSKITEGYINGMYNRNFTDGTYGIYGHDLSDLILHTLYVDGNELTVSCDS